MTAPDANFIWSIADLLRGPYKPKQYGEVILPFTVLTRLDAMLEPTKAEVLAAVSTVAGRPELVVDSTLKRAAGTGFYNTSKYSLSTLGDPANLASNLKAYVAAFDRETREIFTKFKFDDIVDGLDATDRLAMVVTKFRLVNVHPNQVTNHEMGLVFEELIRRFMESSKETAGEFFTPREVIELMVSLLLTPDTEDLSDPNRRPMVYDPTCGTGGMLSVADEWVRRHNNNESGLTLVGQEINPSTYAIAKADMLIKGQDVGNLVNDDTLLRDGHEGKTFTYALSNPPFGVDWKVQEQAVRRERDRDGDKGRFAAGLPPINDGAMLFLEHLVAKMRPAAQGGGRAAIVLNGSPLFTGGAGSGPSEIRRHLIENDLVEAIVGLPTDMFYNTGISTYIWVLTNRKTLERRGKVQLIDATGMWTRMRKGLGSKRRELSAGDIRRIITIHGEFDDADTQFSKVLDNEEMGYRTITVERPLRQTFLVTPELVEEAMANRVIEKLVRSERHDLREALMGLTDGTVWPRENDFRLAVRMTGIAIADATLKALVGVFGVTDEAGELVTDRKGRPLPDPSLRDVQNIPLGQDTDEYFLQEVLPLAPDSWIDHSKTKVGFEIPFTRIFYRYTPPRPLAEIDADLQQVVERILGLLQVIEK